MICHVCRHCYFNISVTVWIVVINEFYQDIFMVTIRQPGENFIYGGVCQKSLTSVSSYWKSTYIYKSGNGRYPNTEVNHYVEPRFISCLQRLQVATITQPCVCLPHYAFVMTLSTTKGAAVLSTINHQLFW